MKDLPLRILVAVIGIPILIFSVLKGGLYFLFIVALIAVLGQLELFSILKSKEIYAQRALSILSGLTILYLTAFDFHAGLFSLLLFFILLIFALEMFRNKGSAILNIAGSLLSLVYPVLFLAALLFFRFNLQDALPVSGRNAAGVFVLTIFVSVWACDTFAYFIGIRFGKHRLFERVSPKKSIEGAVAGLIGALLIFFAVDWVGLLKISVMLKIVSGLVVGIIGQWGDLVESWFKRDAQIKDSSNLLLGHGGILDRFDSLMFVAPAFLIIYFLWS